MSDTETNHRKQQYEQIDQDRRSQHHQQDDPNQSTQQNNNRLCNVGQT